MSDCLLVIDVQNDFCPGGALAVPDGDAVVPVCNRLVEHFDHVILTADWHPAGHRSFASSHAGASPYDSIEMPYGSQILWPDHCVQGTDGAAFHPQLETRRARLVIRKGHDPAIDSYSAFFENDRVTPTGLAGALRDMAITRVVCVGLATDFCVRYSALDAVRCGFSAVVVSEAVRGIDLDGSVAAAWAELADHGVTRLQTGHFLGGAGPAYSA